MASGLPTHELLLISPKKSPIDSSPRKRRTTPSPESILPKNVVLFSPQNFHLQPLVAPPGYDFQVVDFKPPVSSSTNLHRRPSLHSHPDPAAESCLPSSREIIFPFDLRQSSWMFSESHILKLLIDLFPTTQAVEFDDRILIFRVEVLPPKPWPKRIAGVPCYLTDNPNDKGPVIPFRYRSRSKIQISQDLDLRNKNDSLNLISDLVRQFFEQARIPITEIQVWGHIVVIVLEDRIDHDENAMDKILRSVPRSVARCTCLYLSEHHMDRPRMLPAQRLQTASPSRPDGSQYDILRPGVMVSSGINLKGESMRSSSGVLVQNNLGQKFMTVAAHGFPVDGTVYHPHAGGRTIGRLIMELTHTDVALVKLEDGVEFVNEPFENTLTPATSFRLRDFIRIAETQQHDLVYFDSPFSGLAEGERMSRNTMRVPSDDPQEPQQIWFTTQWSYMGQDSAADMVDGVCGSAIWNDDHRVLGFFRYAPVEGLYKDYCLSVAADHLIDGGYSVV